MGAFGGVACKSFVDGEGRGAVAGVFVLGLGFVGVEVPRRNRVSEAGARPGERRFAGYPRVTRSAAARSLVPGAGEGPPGSALTSVGKGSGRWHVGLRPPTPQEGLGIHIQHKNCRKRHVFFFSGLLTENILNCGHVCWGFSGFIFGGFSIELCITVALDFSSAV